MMKYVWAVAIVATIGVVFTGVALKAQGSGGALVVSTCGTLPGTYAVGATRALTVNTNGQVCQ